MFVYEQDTETKYIVKVKRNDKLDWCNVGVLLVISVNPHHLSTKRDWLSRMKSALFSPTVGEDYGKLNTTIILNSTDAVKDMIRGTNFCDGWWVLNKSFVKEDFKKAL